jgi:hypothetical protein
VSTSIGQFSKRVLLTGAGFSRNRGGRLAREMWEEIFSHPAVQKRIAVRQQLLATPSFEVALSEIEGDHRKFLDTGRAAIWEALRQAFERMDVEHVKQLSSGAPKVDRVGMRNFLRRFYAPQHRVGYVFTVAHQALGRVTRIVTTHYRYKRTARKKQAMPRTGPAVVRFARPSRHY